MSTPNIHFKGIPIEYKKISQEDFDSNQYNLIINETIEPNEDGYISDKLLPILTKDLENKNTTIINAGVGQGKTKAIIEVIAKYASNPDYLVIIAVPYKSLIEQYVNDCQKHYDKDKIFDLLSYEENLRGEKSKKENWGYTDDESMLPFSSKLRHHKIHIMTINALLGNPGEDNLFTSKVRSDYFNFVREYCQNTNKKLVWLFDEIHDSIHNFKEQFVYNLWNYHGLVHKTYVVSATFNEASKEVVKYLSEFTNKDIFILESNRNPKRIKQSNLHLNFYVDHKLYQDSNLIDLVSELTKSNKPFDILVYSKDLAEKLFNPNKTPNSKVKKVNDILKNHTNRINRCYSDAFNPRANKKYSNGKNIINIGTNFSTGINIEKENHTFIILFPKDLSVEYVNNKGVFTNGTNVIVQALARQRKKGEIHIFLPNPSGINQKSLPYANNLNEIMYNCFEDYKSGNDRKVDYLPINSHKTLLSNAYEKLDYDIRNAKNNLKQVNRYGLNRLEYPTKEIFILNQGEKYITREFFGGNLPAYILWASISNQFLNCWLTSIKATLRINFNRENLFNEVKDLVYAYADIDALNSLFEEYKFFDSFSGYKKLKIVDEITTNYIFTIDNKNLSITERNKIILMMLAFVLGQSEESNLKDVKSDLQKLYLRSCVYYSNNLQEIKDTLETKDSTCVKIFKKWHELIDVIYNSRIKVKGIVGLYRTPNSEFEEIFNKLNFIEDLKYLLDNDFLISSDVFQFKNTINTAIKNKTLLDTFYKESIKFYFNHEPGQTSKNRKKVLYYKIGELDLKYTPNFLYEPLPEVVL
ncbi:MAG: DEAD/DEAH box helicase family protein [Gelidibacter sp.]